jgi:hypothetical protein
MVLFRGEEEKRFSIWLKAFVVYVVVLSVKLESQLRKVFATLTVIDEQKKGVLGDFG